MFNTHVACEGFSALEGRPTYAEIARKFVQIIGRLQNTAGARILVLSVAVYKLPPFLRKLDYEKSPGFGFLPWVRHFSQLLAVVALQMAKVVEQLPDPRQRCIAGPYSTLE